MLAVEGGLNPLFSRDGFDSFSKPTHAWKYHQEQTQCVQPHPRVWSPAKLTAVFRGSSSPFLILKLSPQPQTVTDLGARVLPLSRGEREVEQRRGATKERASHPKASCLPSIKAPHPPRPRAYFSSTDRPGPLSTDVLERPKAASP